MTWALFDGLPLGLRKNKTQQISIAEEIVDTTIMIAVRDELLPFPAKTGTLLLLKHS